MPISERIHRFIFNLLWEIKKKVNPNFKKSIDKLGQYQQDITSGKKKYDEKEAQKLKDDIKF